MFSRSSSVQSSSWLVNGLAGPIEWRQGGGLDAGDSANDEPAQGRTDHASSGCRRARSSDEWTRPRSTAENSGDEGIRTPVLGRNAKASTGLAGALVSPSGSAPAGESGRPVP